MQTDIWTTHMESFVAEVVRVEVRFAVVVSLRPQAGSTRLD